MKLFIYLLLNCLSYFYLLTQLLLYVSLKFLRSIGNTRFCIKLHITSWGNCFRCRIYRCRISYLLLSNVINKLFSTLRQRESCPVGVEIADTFSEPSKIDRRWACFELGHTNNKNEISIRLPNLTVLFCRYIVASKFVNW